MSASGGSGAGGACAASAAGRGARGKDIGSSPERRREGHAKGRPQRLLAAQYTDVPK